MLDSCFNNQEKKPKVAFVITKLGVGGAEKNLLNLIRYFNEIKVGFEYDLILFKNVNDYKKAYKDVFKSINIYTLLKTSRKIPSWMKLFKGIEILIKLSLIVIKKNYALLIAAEEYPFFLTSFIAKLFNKKSILIVGNNIREEIQRENYIKLIFNFFIFKLSFILADLIITVSEGLALSIESYFKINKNKIKLIYNGINVEEISSKSKIPLSKKLTVFFKKHDVFITLGRLIERKGYSYLISAFSEIVKKCPKARLVIIGKGPFEDKLREICRLKKAENFVTFLDCEIENPYKYLSKAKFFIFSSLYEGFGNVLIEALACGLPVISTDCEYGPREILCETRNSYKKTKIKLPVFCKYGILIPLCVKNKRLITKTIINILNNKNKIRAFYRKRVLERARFFSISKMGNSYLNLINQFCCKNKLKSLDNMR